MSDNRHSVNLEVPAGRARGLARTSSVQASTRLCTRAHPRARVHVPHARMHIDEQACMCLVHACISTSTRACASCTHARRRARMHVPRARMHVDEQACMCLVHACISASTCSCASCTHAQRRARMHVPRARMHNGMHACKDTCTFAASTCWLAVRCACVHEHVQASRPACIHVVSPLTCVSACSRFDCLQLVWPVSFPAVDNRISVDDDLIVIFTVLARVLTKSARNENSWLELHEAGLK